jgi:hypothetical protein
MDAAWLSELCAFSGRSPCIRTAFANMAVCACCDRHARARPRSLYDIDAACSAARRLFFSTGADGNAVVVADDVSPQDAPWKTCACDCRLLTRMIVRTVWGEEMEQRQAAEKEHLD